MNPPAPRLGYAWYVVGVLMVAYVVSFVDRLILGLLVQPIKSDLGITDTQIGLLAGIGFGLFYTIMGVPLARLADRVNRRWLIIAGVTLWSLMTAASAFATSFTGLLVARVGVGVGEATLTPAAASLIADYFPRDRIAQAMGVYSMGLYLGSGAALLLGSVVVQALAATGPVTLPLLGHFGAWQLAFLIAAAPGVLVVALLLTVREPPRREADGAIASTRQAAASVKELLAFIAQHRVLLGLHCLGYGALGTAVTAWLVWAPEMLRRAHDIPISQAGFVIGTLLLVFGTAGPYLGGWWSRRAAAAGHADAEIRVSAIAAALLAPLVIIGPLVADLTLATVVLAPLLLLLSLPQGLAPTVLQLMAPNRMRAQLLAAFVLVAVVFAYAVGPAAVPLVAQYVFGSEQALDRAMALVCGLLVPIAAMALRLAQPRYRQFMQAGAQPHA